MSKLFSDVDWAAVEEAVDPGAFARLLEVPPPPPPIPPYGAAFERFYAEAARVVEDELRTKVQRWYYIGSKKNVNEPAPPMAEASRFEALKERLRTRSNAPCATCTGAEGDHERGCPGHPNHIPTPPPVPPVERWRQHVDREARIAGKMRKRDRHARPPAPDRGWLAPYEPSTSGFGGGFVAVWRRR